MSEVCALGGIFVKKKKLLFSLLLYTFLHVVRKISSLKTNALLCFHPSLELDLKVSKPKGNYLVF